MNPRNHVIQGELASGTTQRFKIKHTAGEIVQDIVVDVADGLIQFNTNAWSRASIVQLGGTANITEDNFATIEAGQRHFTFYRGAELMADLEMTITEASTPNANTKFSITIIMTRKGHFPFLDGDVQNEIADMLGSRGRGGGGAVASTAPALGPPV